MESFFHDLASSLGERVAGGEVASLWFSGERSDFARFNRGKVRQAGSVSQAMARLSLTDKNRQASAELSLSGDLALDRAAVAEALGELRLALPDLPEDPHLLSCNTPRVTSVNRVEPLPEASSMVDDVVAAAASFDLVGLLASGPIYRGFASSLGHRCFHQASSFLVDYSLYLPGDLAVKGSYAGQRWEGAELARRVAGAGAAAGKPRRSLEPGRYRVFLTPAAMAEIGEMLSWGGFSRKAINTRQSALVRLYDGEASLSPLVTLRENTAGGLAPAFQAEGFARPAAAPLVEAGRAAGALVSPRTAREYGVEHNGAAAGEGPESLDMAAGSLPSAGALAALGDGLWIGNLWYLNFSDRLAGRITGMTRFATFWVERGQIAATVAPMRFDDSLFDLLGSRLEALTAERELMPNATTYGERQTSSMRLPGALVDGMTFTL